MTRKEVYKSILEKIYYVSKLEKNSGTDVSRIIKEAHNQVSLLTINDFGGDEELFNKSKIIILAGVSFRNILLENLERNNENVYTADKYIMARLELLSIQNALCIMPWEIDK